MIIEGIDNQIYALEEELLSSVYKDPSLIDKYDVKKDSFSYKIFSKIFGLVLKFKEQYGSDYSSDIIKSHVFSHTREEKKADWQNVFYNLDHKYTENISSNTSFLNNRIRELKGVRALNDNFSLLKDNISSGDYEYFDKFKKDIDQINLFAGKTGSYSLHSSMLGAFDYLEKGFERGEAISGFASGLDILDKMLSGFNATDLVTIAARPAMGKTALAITLADNMANRFNTPVGFVSSEMPREQLALRMIARNTGINSVKMRRFDLLEQSDLDKIRNFIPKIENSPFHVNDKAGISSQEIEEQVKIWTNESDVKVVFVDYLQKIKYKGVGAEKMPKHEKIGEITSDFKNMAKKYGICMVQLAQLNREAEGSDPNERPGLEHLKGSGDIEQESDSIIFPFRANARTDNSQLPKKTELIIPKNRHGPVGTADCLWNPTSVSFEDLDDDEIDF